MALRFVGLRENVPYDHNEAFAAYTKYIAGEGPLEDVLLWQRMFIARTLMWRYSHVLPDALEDMAQDCALLLWQLVQRKKLPSNKSAAYRGYSQMVILNACKHYFKKHEREQVEKILELCGNWDGGYVGRYPTRWDVEADVLVGELPRMLIRRIAETLRMVVHHSRYEAVEYVVHRLLHSRPIPLRWLEVRFGVSRPDFFVTHIRVRARMEMYRLRDTVHPAARDAVYDLRSMRREILTGQRQCR